MAKMPNDRQDSHRGRTPFGPTRPVMARTPNDRLDSWKEIADYLHRDITTVIRWEKEKGLPVHRVPGGKRHAVFAYPGEIDRWMASGARDSEFGVRASEPGVGGQWSAARPPGLVHQRDITQFTIQNSQFRTQKRFWLAVLGMGAIGLLAAAVLLMRFNSSPSFPRIIGSRPLTSDGRVKSLATDGARLYFTEDTAEGFTWVEMPISGGAPTPIPTPIKHLQILDISVTRGALLVAETNPGNRPSALWLMPLVGGAPRRVAGVSAYDAALSPDGRVIAYAEGRNLYICKADGSEARKVASLPRPGGSVAWPPDASFLRLSIQDDNGSVRLWQVRADGSGLHPVLPGWQTPPDQYGDRWTPDGKYFLFFRRAEQGRNDIWALRENQGIFRSGGLQASALTAGPLDCHDLVPGLDGKGLFFIGV